MIAAYSMYVIGLFVAIGIAAILHLADKGENPNILLIELPEYKAPSARTVAIYVWEKVKDFVTKAGTTIFLASVIMWFILNFGPGGYTTEMEASFGAVLGKVIVPFSSLWAWATGRSPWRSSRESPPKRWLSPAVPCCSESPTSIPWRVWSSFRDSLLPWALAD